MQESSLHAALKDFYTRPGDLQETWLDGYLVDVLRGEQVVEIQTGNFSAIKPKLLALLPDHPLLLVHPIAQEKWIVRQEDERQTRRRSPRRGRVEDIFYQLVRFPWLIEHPNLSLEIPLIQVEEIWRNDGRGSWRRKGWSIADRRLLAVLERRSFTTPADFRRLLPDGLAEPFTTRELATAAGITAGLGYKMVYCLRKMGLIQPCGKRGRTVLYHQSG
jgi:hypothetical protein